MGAFLVAATGALLLGGVAALPVVRPVIYALTGVAIANPVPFAQFGVIYLVVGLGVVTVGHYAQSGRHAAGIVALALAGVATVGALAVGTATQPLLLQTTQAAPVAVAYLVGVGRTPLDRAVAALGAVTPLALRYALTAPGPVTAVPSPALTTAFLATMNAVAALPVVYLGWRTRHNA